MQNIWIKSIIIIGLLSVFCVMPAMAQDQQSAVDDKADYTNDELKSFITANVGIYQVQQQIASQMPNMESEEQKQELVVAANQQMEQVLQSNGLTADEYNAMGQTIQGDTQLQEKVNSIAVELFQLDEEPQ
ncbi:MAG: hypothetical protein NMNS01_09340 [Nitrosomonas sp.]|nr:MAG: hypothetical protein NMNS01_09340 [Nitrosomonas sp.]